MKTQRNVHPSFLPAVSDSLTGAVNYQEAQGCAANQRNQITSSRGEGAGADDGGEHTHLAVL